MMDVVILGTFWLVMLLSAATCSTILAVLIFGEDDVSKYIRKIKETTGTGAAVEVDVYDVLQAFDVQNPAIQHAVKKLLCPGTRGAKDLIQDLEEARDSISRAIQLAESD